MTSVDARIVSILARSHDVDPDSVRSDVSFDELGLDSLAVVEFIEQLQEEFEVSLSDDDLSKTETISDVLALLQARGIAA